MVDTYNFTYSSPFFFKMLDIISSTYDFKITTSFFLIITLFP